MMCRHDSACSAMVRLLAPERHAAALCAAHTTAYLSCSCMLQMRALWTSVRAAYRWRASRRCCCAMRPPVLPQVCCPCFSAHVGVDCEMRHCWRQIQVCCQVALTWAEQ